MHWGIDALLLVGILLCIRQIRQLRDIVDRRNVTPPETTMPDIPVDERIKQALQTHYDRYHRRS